MTAALRALAIRWHEWRYARGNALRRRGKRIVEKADRRLAFWWGRE